MPPDLSISNEEMEVFAIEIICKNLTNILIGTQYIHNASKGKIYENASKNILTQPKQGITNLCYRQLEFKSTWPQS